MCSSQAPAQLLFPLSFQLLLQPGSLGFPSLYQLSFLAYSPGVQPTAQGKPLKWCSEEAELRTVCMCGAAWEWGCSLGTCGLH